MIKRIGFTVVAVLAFSMAAQAADSFAGKWELNKAKSKLSNPEQVGATAVIDARPDGGWKLNLSQPMKDGKTETWYYTCSGDGKECPAKVSNGDYDTISIKRADANNAVTVMTKKGGKFKMTDTGVVSKDGKSLSGTSEGTDANGKHFSAVWFFDRK